MESKSPIKSSSRAGRFKKKLVPESQLQMEAPLIEARMAPFLAEYARGEITDAELTGIYILSILAQRMPRHWLGAKRPSFQLAHRLPFPLARLSLAPNIRRRLENFSTLGDVFENFALQSTPAAVNRALLAWSSGAYDLVLMFKIPNPAQVLELQQRGRRVVTVPVEAGRSSSYILGERDALSFTMHDLIHADHFYHDNQCYQGQLGFYGLLAQSMRQGLFTDLLTHEKFLAEFEYLISDMNAYAIHLLKCFKSALVHYHPGFFEQWLSQLAMSAKVYSALLELNQASYNPQDQDPLLLDWLQEFRFRE